MLRKTSPALAEIVPDLLSWFDGARRDLPWRTPPGVPREPYRVWLAEIMLQQTTVSHAAPYFHAFTARWPTVDTLAAAADADVMQAWAGLGYYARARNLLKCARAVAGRGGFPGTETELLGLPGIGPYTAGAIAALAFGQAAPAIDGNAERVFARLLAAPEDWPTAKKRIGALARRIVPQDRPGDFAEALMDLGATVCTPKRPACAQCPLRPHCAALREGEPERYPIKLAKVARPTRYGSAYVLIRGEAVWLVRRPPSGLLGGMIAFPASPWDERRVATPPPLAADWSLTGEVHHIFTHFTLKLDVYVAQTRRKAIPEGYWAPVSDLSGLPTVFAKAAGLAGLTATRKR